MFKRSVKLYDSALVLLDPVVTKDDPESQLTFICVFIKRFGWPTYSVIFVPKENGKKDMYRNQPVAHMCVSLDFTILEHLLNWKGYCDN